jgi:hypothetical protein
MTSPASHQKQGAQSADHPEGQDQTTARWVDKSGIAAHHKIGVRTVTTWMKQGILPYVKIRNIVRFNVADCEQALRKYEVKRK